MVTVGSADEAASIVLDEALKASNQGTFAVGALLFSNKTGEILIEKHNDVLRPSSNGAGLFTWDPTAHGERQIVSWYYENKGQCNLPNPEDLTLVTSLDPCVMCSGALLTAGFNVGVIANDTFAGINYDKTYDFPALPDNLKSLIRSKFGYYAVGDPSSDPPKYARAYAGPESLNFKSDCVSSQHLAGCSAIFDESVNHVRNVSNQKSGKAPDSMTDPADLSDDSPIKTAFQRIYPNAFKLKTKNFRFPDKGIIEELERVASNRHGKGNAVSFIDPFGNLILCMPGQEELNPIRLPFIEVAQNYSKTRWNLLNDPITSSTAGNTLTHPKYGTFLYLYAPDPDIATTLMSLGAYGSTMEGPIPQIFPTNLQYVHPPKKGSVSELMYAIFRLPPFYTTYAQISISRTPTDI